MAVRRGSFRGDAALRANLRTLAKIYTGSAMDEDIEVALQPLHNETVANAKRLRDYAGKYPGFPAPASPRQGGHLDQGVVSKRVAGTARSRTWWVAFGRRGRKLAHLVEFGTAPHFQPNFKGGFMHPGSRPRPFFRQAFNSKKGAVLSTLKRRVELRLYTAAARLRTRT